jgi:hypothetical protein
MLRNKHFMIVKVSIKIVCLYFENLKNHKCDKNMFKTYLKIIIIKHPF